MYASLSLSIYKYIYIYISGPRRCLAFPIYRAYQQHGWNCQSAALAVYPRPSQGVKMRAGRRRVRDASGLQCAADCSRRGTCFQREAFYRNESTATARWCWAGLVAGGANALRRRGVRWPRLIIICMYCQCSPPPKGRRRLIFPFVQVLVRARLPPGASPASSCHRQLVVWAARLLRRRNSRGIAVGAGACAITPRLAFPLKARAASAFSSIAVFSPWYWSRSLSRSWA